MALDSTLLRDKLLELCDVEHDPFHGFPTTRAAARAKWASAFSGYFDEAQEKIEPSPPGHPTLVMTAVQAAFKADLDLTSSISAAISAADFAGAWQAGVSAVAPGGMATDGSGAQYSAFSGFTNVPALHATLLATLTTLFSSPSISTVQRIGAIADAFHAATSSLIAAVTQTTGSSAVTPFPMGIR